MNNRYFVVGQQRSGTTLIHLLLKGHPNVSALSDELRAAPFFAEGLRCLTHGKDYPKEKGLGYVRLFDAVTTLLATPETMAHGAKCVCNSKKGGSNSGRGDRQAFSRYENHSCGKK